LMIDYSEGVTPQLYNAFSVTARYDAT
jgi:hypothetical protein